MVSATGALRSRMIANIFDGSSSNSSRIATGGGNVARVTSPYNGLAASAKVQKALLSRFQRL